MVATVHSVYTYGVHIIDYYRKRHAQNECTTNIQGTYLPSVFKCNVLNASVKCLRQIEPLTKKGEQASNG